MGTNRKNKKNKQTKATVISQSELNDWLIQTDNNIVKGCYFVIFLILSNPKANPRLFGFTRLDNVYNLNHNLTRYSVFESNWILKLISLTDPLLVILNSTGIGIQCVVDQLVHYSLNTQYSIDMKCIYWAPKVRYRRMTLNGKTCIETLAVVTLCNNYY